MIESGAMSGAFFEAYCVTEIVTNLKYFGKKRGYTVDFAGPLKLTGIPFPKASVNRDGAKSLRP